MHVSGEAELSSPGGSAFGAAAADDVLTVDVDANGTLAVFAPFDGLGV